jgi:hypothetical protein
MRRREFISLLGGAAAVPSLLWPLAARAQQSSGHPSVGLLSPLSETTAAFAKRPSHEKCGGSFEIGKRLAPVSTRLLLN